jgi:hypothetical protein
VASSRRTFIAGNVSPDGLPTVTGFTDTFLMATGFLLVCLLAGFLVPKMGTEAATAESGQGTATVGAAAPEGAQA